jgi:hypothetical protein
MDLYIDDIFYNKVQSEIYEKITINKLVPVEILDLKISDKILVNFHPYLPKHIKSLYSKMGIIKSIDFNKLNDDVTSFVTIKNYKEEEEYLLHESVSNYDDSLGYDYSIFLIL